MKRCFVYTVSALAVLMPLPVWGMETIRAFDSALTLTRGDDAFIQERIVYDFGDTPRHGIFRNLPRYQCPGSVCVSSGVEFFSPTRDGQREEYVNSTKGNAIQIRIGDPVVEVDGVHEYLLRYSVKHAVVEKPEGQLVSWNVTGDEWKAPILLSTYTIEGPVVPTSVRCFAGARGGGQENCAISTSGTRVMVTLNRGLGSYEGWTVDALYPKGTFSASIRPVPKPPIPYWVIAAGALVLFWAGVWWLFGRDARGRGTIIPEYDPPKELKPYEAEALIHDTPSVVGLTATILDFARRGLLTIKTKEGIFKNSYTLHKTNAPVPDLDEAERAAYQVLFGEGDVFETGAFARSTTRATNFALWRTAVSARMKGRGWYQFNADHARGISIFLLAVMTIAIVVIGTRYVAGELFFLSGIGFLGALPFAYAMPRMTRDGTLLVEHLKGFKRYIKVAEKDRLAFHEAPEKTPERFSRLLPFAIALGEAGAWAKIFQDVGLSPEQLQSYGVGMNAVMIGSLSNSLSTGIRSSVSAPSGGGGGFSGGGGGGGGGGSW